MAIWAHSAAVTVRDRRKATEWYHSVLGFTVLDDDPEHWTTVGNRRTGARIHLCEIHGRPRGPHRTDPTNTGILLLTSEPFPRLCGRLAKKGVRFSLPPREVPWGWIAKFLDPDDNEFWLMPAPKAAAPRKRARG
ncbi:MAG TPA: VOC family protein [Thermoplasmata archaeon]|jgi:predicted enzyme related to lactoylglutathione lyase|nr:VOC family protein [Thermoplasmata archaeon]